MKGFPGGLVVQKSLVSQCARRMSSANCGALLTAWGDSFGQSRDGGLLAMSGAADGSMAWQCAMRLPDLGWPQGPTIDGSLRHELRQCDRKGGLEIQETFKAKSRSKCTRRFFVKGPFSLPFPPLPLAEAF